MSTQAPEALTASAKALLRTGKCVSLRCREKCQEFVFDAVKDGFRTCTCEHTQHAHERVKA